MPQWLKCIRMMGEPPRPAQHQVGVMAWQYDVDITAAAHRKREAMAAHGSQLPGGEPEAMFPDGIVSLLLSREHFEDASGVGQEWVAEILESPGG